MSDQGDLVCPICERPFSPSGDADLSTLLWEHFQETHPLEGGEGELTAAAAERVNRPTPSDPSGPQTTENPLATSADARLDKDSHGREATPKETLAQGVDWMKATMGAKASSPPSSTTPPMGSMLIEKINGNVGMDTPPKGQDLGRPEERGRVLRTGPGVQGTPPGMAPTVETRAREGEVGAHCPLCGTLVLAMDMDSLNHGLKSHVERVHPNKLKIKA